MIRAMHYLWAGTMKLLSIPAVKLGLAIAIAAPIALVADAPVHDVWFDIVLFFALNSIVTGAPEPDLWKTMSVSEAMYLWYYRASHSFLASATSYFAHPSTWGKVPEGKEK